MEAMQLAFDGSSCPAAPWPNWHPVVAGPKLFEITYTRSARIVVEARERAHVDDAAWRFTPDSYDFDGDDYDVYELSPTSGEIATHKLDATGRIREIKSGAESAITREMVLNEVALRVERDYPHLAGRPYAEECALRDIQRDWALRVWPSVEFWKQQNRP